MTTNTSLPIILTYHVEGERETPSAEVYREVEEQVQLADRLGYHAAWFAEHHFHLHRGHLPNPLLMALSLAGRTQQIRLGSAVICVALHDPLRLASDLLTADVLCGGRLSIGLGSGSTPVEFEAFGVSKEEQTAEARHQRFAEYLDVLEQAWRGEAVRVQGRYVRVEAPPLLPQAIRPVTEVLWIAANSESQARVAGQRGYGLMLSRERRPGEMERIVAAYQQGRAERGWSEAGERVAASRPMYVGTSDEDAARAASKAVTIMLARQREAQGKASQDDTPPVTFEEACRQVQFVAGSPETVAQAIQALRAQVPFTTLHVQPRWQGLAQRDVLDSLRRFMQEVVPMVESS